MSPASVEVEKRCSRERVKLIDFIKGKIIEDGSGWVVVENNGLGYRVEVPVSSSDHGYRQGEETVLYTRLLWKEDGLFLYGFGSAEERNLFNLILGVGGFGPRNALSILGKFTVSQFYVAVIEENVKALSGVPGIGRKSSQRLILELKEKLPASFSPSAGEALEAPVMASSESETVEALTSLGFSGAEATAAVEHAKASVEKGSPEELLKVSLKYLSYR